MHKRIVSCLLMLLTGIAVALFACIAFRADWFSAWYDRVLFAVIAVFFLLIETGQVIGSIRELRKPDTRIWSPDRSTRKKKQKPKKISKK